MRRFGSFGYGLPAKRRGAAPVSVPPTLLALSLSSSTVVENAPNGTIIGTIVGTSPGSVVTMQGGSDARLTVSSSGGAWRLVTTGAAIDYDAGTTSLLFGLVETLAGATGTPKTTAGLSVNVINQNDTNPSAFSFTDVTGVATGSTQTSDAITIAGLGASDSAAGSISGDASSQWQKNGGAWSTGAFTVVNNDQVKVRHAASGANSTAVNTVLTVGTTSDTFTSTTAVAPSSLTLSQSASLTGVPRQGETNWIGTGLYTGGTVNKRRYSVYLDGVLMTGFPVVTTEEGISFAWAAGAAGKVPTATEEASSDNGATYTAPAAVPMDFLYPADIIEPTSIAKPTLARETGSGATPPTLSLTGPVQSSYMIEVRTAANAAMDSGVVSFFFPVSETELSTPNTARWDMAIAADRWVDARYMTQDYSTDATASGAPDTGIASPRSDPISITDAVVPVIFGSQSGITTTNAGKTVAAAGSGPWGILANRGASATEKVYWEFVYDDTSTAMAGVADDSIATTPGLHGWWYSASGCKAAVIWDTFGEIYVGGANTGVAIGTIAAGNVIAFELDRGALTLKVRNVTAAGAWSAAVSLAGFTGAIKPAFQGEQAQVTGHFAAADWVGAPQAGFVEL